MSINLGTGDLESCSGRKNRATQLNTIFIDGQWPRILTVLYYDTVKKSALVEADFSRGVAAMTYTRSSQKDLGGMVNPPIQIPVETTHPRKNHLLVTNLVLFDSSFHDVLGPLQDLAGFPCYLRLPRLL